MLECIVRRFIQTMVVLFVISILVLMLTNSTSGPVNMLVPESATTEQAESARARLGLDKPLPVQYAIFLRGVLRGNFDKSYTYGKPAMGLILERIPATMELVAIAAPLVLIIAIPLGVHAGAYPRRASSKIIISDSILDIPLPSFWVGMMMICISAVTLGKLPASGRGGTVDVLGMNPSIFAPGGIRFIILPTITLAIANVATILRLTGSGTLENVRWNYVKLARTKGASPRTLLFGHVLENALIPVITISDMDLRNMIAFTIIAETISAWPGTGKLLIDATNKSDGSIIVAYLMATACMFVMLNFVADLLYILIDPRIGLR